ncbi:MAG: response regulator transcription factor [Pseudomonadales bacterium]|nr:response regulator transcription factor [Pseudomonadales bacterium]MCP5302969.1 response regulator transcription factor [Pseudomonadales bacterium]
MNILIADDHTFIRSGLQDNLKQIMPQAVIFNADSATQALQLAAQNIDFRLAIVDLFMPDMDGFAFLRKLCTNHPELPIIVISATDNPAHVRKVLELGAMGFIPKSSSTQQFNNVVNIVLSGGTHIPASFADSLRLHDAEVSIADNADTEEALLKRQLTVRQKEILAKLGEGKSNKQIARELLVSENTVKVHVSSILKVLKLDNRTQAGIAAEKLNLL